MANLGILGQSLSGGTLNPVPPNASREQQITAINDIINRLNAILKGRQSGLSWATKSLAGQVGTSV